jgi:hypothetical protein
MDRDQLRALQAPLKQRYREDPGSALITQRADGSLEEQVACSVSTGNGPPATSLGVKLRGGRVTAEGDLDVRGTLGIEKDVPVGFKQIRLRIVLDADASPDERARLMELTERYCVFTRRCAAVLGCP